MSAKMRTSGSLLSALFFQQINSPGDQEGFLIGEICSRVTDTISDSQIQNLKEETITYIYSFLPCKSLLSFYDVTGKVDIGKVSAITGSQNKNVIGWYKFRRNSTLRPSLRETCIHSHLSKLFPGVQSQQFVFALFTATLSSNQSTHSFDHTFLQFNKRMFTPSPVEVTNLGDSTHSLYRMSGSVNTGLYADTVTQFVSQFANQDGQIKEVNNIDHMSRTLYSKLKDLSMEVASSEEKLAQAYAEVESLRALIRPERKPLPKEPPSEDDEAPLIDMECEIPPPMPPKGRVILDPPPPYPGRSTKSYKPLPPEPSSSATSDNINRSGNGNHNNNCSTDTGQESADDTSAGEDIQAVISSPELGRKDSGSSATVSQPETKAADPFSFVDDLIKKGKSPSGGQHSKGGFPNQCNNAHHAKHQKSKKMTSSNASGCGDGDSSRQNASGFRHEPMEGLDEKKDAKKTAKSSEKGALRKTKDSTDNVPQSNNPGSTQPMNIEFDKNIGHGKPEKELKITHKPGLKQSVPFDGDADRAAPLAAEEDSEEEEVKVILSNSPTF